MEFPGSFLQTVELDKHHALLPLRRERERKGEIGISPGKKTKQRRFTRDADSYCLRVEMG